MKCKYMNLIHKKIEKIIIPDEEQVLNEHLKKCSLCQKQLVFLTKINLILSKEKIPAPFGFTEKVLDKIAEKKMIFLPVKIPTLKWALVPAVAIILLILVLPFVIRRQKTIIVKFELQLPSAQTVSLAGDFNNWDIDNRYLKRQDGTWFAEVPLKPGRYQYVFVIDGKKWFPDPKAYNCVDNGYGSKNSVLDTTRL